MLMKSLSLWESTDSWKNIHSNIGSNVTNRVDYILEIIPMGTDLIFLLDGERVGIIEYSLDMNHKTCYIWFFGTQNGEAKFIENKKLLQLDAVSQWNNSKKHLSYAMIQYLVENVCLPNNIEKIYLHPDDQEKTIFWKYKIGAYFKSTGVFSQVTDRDVIWFTLSAKK